MIRYDSTASEGPSRPSGGPFPSPSPQRHHAWIGMRSLSRGLDQDASWTAARQRPPMSIFGRARISGRSPRRRRAWGSRERGGHVDGSTQARPGRRDAGDHAGDGRGGLGLPQHAERGPARDRSTRRRASRRRRWGSTPRPIRTSVRAAPMPIARYPDSLPCRVPPVRAAHRRMGCRRSWDRAAPSSFGTPPPGSPGMGSPTSNAYGRPGLPAPPMARAANRVARPGRAADSRAVRCPLT